MISRYRLVPLLVAASCAVAPGLATRAGAQVAAAGAAAPANGVGTAFELAFWQSVSGSSDPAMFTAYLEQYPTGTFASLARAKIAAVRRADPVAVAAVAMPAATPPQSAPVTVPVAAALAAAPTEMKLIPAVVAPFAVQTAPAPAAQPAPSILGNTALLAALAQSQVTGNAPAAANAPALPARPIMAAVPTLTIPDHFCSAEARNQYHDAVYKPAMAVAAANDASAVGYLQALDAQYRAFGAQSDAAGMNAMAAGSRAYQPVASEAYTTSNAYRHLFDRIMAAPITACRS